MSHFFLISRLTVSLLFTLRFTVTLLFRPVAEPSSSVKTSSSSILHCRPFTGSTHSSPIWRSLSGISLTEPVPPTFKVEPAARAFCDRRESSASTSSSSSIIISSRSVLSDGAFLAASLLALLLLGASLAPLRRGTSSSSSSCDSASAPVPTLASSCFRLPADRPRGGGTF